MRVVIVVPIYYGRNVTLVRTLATDAEGLGVEVIAFCNSEAAQAKAQEAGLEVISCSENVGYGRAANFVAERQRFDWLVLCNDDLEIPQQDLAGFVGIMRSLQSLDGWTVGLLERDHRPLHPIPGVLGVLSNVSLLRAVIDRRRSPKIVQHPPGVMLSEVRPGTAFPFICVAISSSAWRAVGGFDPEFLLYFEDTDFLARASRIEGQRFGVVRARMKHQHSSSTRRDLRTTVPVFAWSAYVYLTRHTNLGPRTSRAAISAALLARLVLAVMARDSVKEHLWGTVRAFRTILGGRKPDLPPWRPRLGINMR